MARGPVDVAAFAGLARGQRLMGLDLGTKTIGLALSDAERTSAGPLRVIRRVKFGIDAADLLAEAARQDVAGLVAGLPLNMDASEGPRAQSARAFMRGLEALTPLPYAFWDERLSTVAAERELIGRDVSRAKRALVIDAAAAAHILQGALDRLAYARAQERRAREDAERDGPREHPSDERP